MSPHQVREDVQPNAGRTWFNQGHGHLLKLVKCWMKTWWVQDDWYSWWGTMGMPELHNFIVDIDYRYMHGLTFLRLGTHMLYRLPLTRVWWTSSLGSYVSGSYATKLARDRSCENMLNPQTPGSSVRKAAHCLLQKSHNIHPTDNWRYGYFGNSDNLSSQPSNNLVYCTLIITYYATNVHLKCHIRLLFNLRTWC